MDTVLAPRRNFDLKEEIRAYWSERAATFDRSPGHHIRTGAELAAWVRTFRQVAPLPAGARVLELACGTGEVTRVLRALELEIDAVDFAEPMLERARAKHGDQVTFHLADAENPPLPEGAFDAVVARHLVWTLTEPAAALAAWARLLKPGGVLIVIDGDWVSLPAWGKLGQRWAHALDRRRGVAQLWDQAAHERILQRLPFAKGLRRERLEAMLREAGFTRLRRHRLLGVRFHQLRGATWAERLRLAGYVGNTFLLAANKPA